MDATIARHRKPAVIRQLEGNPGKRPIPNEIAGRGKPRCPDHLSDAQKRCWQAVVRSLPEGILTSADGQVLERMAIAWALHREAARLIGEGAVLVKGHDSRPTKSVAHDHAAGLTGNGALRHRARPYALCADEAGGARSGRYRPDGASPGRERPLLDDRDHRSPIARPALVPHHLALRTPHAVAKMALVRGHRLEADRVANAL